MNALVVGDVHGKWKLLRDTIVKNKADIIFQVGDFGYWPRFNGYKIPGEGIYSLSDIPTDICEIHFLDGNHEDHFSIKELIQDNKDNKEIKIDNNLFYHPRATTYKIQDNNIMFVGGALSIDGIYRKVGHDYFPDLEVLGESLFYNLPDEKVDIIMSHTCPEFLIPTLEKQLNIKVEERFRDPSTKILEELYNRYHPKKWFFGHWHTSLKLTRDDTEFICLDMLNDDKRRMGYHSCCDLF